MPLALFALVLLEIRSLFLPRLAWIVIFLFWASCSCRDARLVSPHPVFSLRWGQQTFLFFCPYFSFPRSQGYRCEPGTPGSFLLLLLSDVPSLSPAELPAFSSPEAQSPGSSSVRSLSSSWYPLDLGSAEKFLFHVNIV
jgi:hypothetical protein